MSLTGYAIRPSGERVDAQADQLQGGAGGFA